MNCSKEVKELNICEDETKPYDDYDAWRDGVFGEFYVGALPAIRWKYPDPDDPDTKFEAINI
jgi:hypothetical protein